MGPFKTLSVHLNENISKLGFIEFYILGYAEKMCAAMKYCSALYMPKGFANSIRNLNSSFSINSGTFSSHDRRFLTTLHNYSIRNFKKLLCTYREEKLKDDPLVWAFNNTPSNLNTAKISSF